MVNFPTIEFSAQLIDLSPAEEPELIVLSFVEDPDDEDCTYRAVYSGGSQAQGQDFRRSRQLIFQIRAVSLQTAPLN